MPRHVLTHQLELATLPAADADSVDIIRFAQTYNGYKAVGREGVGEMARRLDGEDPSTFTLEELRLALFARQRAHYHQGGGWPGEPDTLMEEMRDLVTRIRQRVAVGEHETGVQQRPEIRVWTGDITTLRVDAIVNAANEALLGGGGVDGAIHRAAGPKLLEACREIPEVSPGVRCPTGQARLTFGYQLAATRVLHAVGPRWRHGSQGEDDALASAYRSVLGLAEAHQLEAIAIPAISTGVYGFPPARAARIAAETIRAWRERECPFWVTLVGYDAAASAVLRDAIESV